MKTYRIVALMLMAFQLSAQTAAELLQKGIYDQETAGDFDGAIAIYHQIVNSGSSPRDVAAQAQYRLAQSLLQKGDLPNGAQEFSNLARNYADYGKLVSNLATQARGLSRTSEYASFADFAAEQRAKAELAGLKAQQAAAMATGSPEQQAQMREKLRDAVVQLERLAVEQQGFSGGGGRGVGRSMALVFYGPPTTVTGTVASIVFIAPAGAITVDSSNGTAKRYRFNTAGPAELARQGFTYDSLRPGAQVTISGVLATNGETADGMITGSATTITGPDGRKLFDRAEIPK